MILPNQLPSLICCSFKNWCILILFFALGLNLQAQEICNNGIDDDGDGQIDCYDSGCAGQVACDSFFYGFPVNNCQIQPPVGPFGVSLVWQSTVDVSTRSVAFVGDIDGDGMPEVVTHYKQANQIYILDGATGVVEVTITGPAISDYSNAIAIADVDGDGLGEIYAIDANGLLQCYENNGTAKVGYTPSNTGNFEAAPNIADFNGDGVPEVYVGNKIFNSLTGAVIGAGTGSTGANAGSAWHSAAADLMPTGACPDCAGLELACGNRVYSVNISTGAVTALPNSLTGLGDGFTAIADMNMDGSLDVVVTNAGKIYVWNPASGLQLGTTYNIPSTGNGGRANIADYDNDGKPEIGVGGNNRYVMLDYDIATNLMTPAWIKTIVDGSQMTTGSAFDFEGDGSTEVVYRDENNLMVFNGATGATKLSIPCGSATRTEFPTVADVDADGKADIICNCSTANQSSTGKVRVYKSSGVDWIAARRVMNQHSYSITNINEDLTVPIVQQNNSVFQQINSFLSQAPYFDANWNPIFIPVSDLDINLDTIVFCATPNQFQVTLTVCNYGSKKVNSNIPITFYNGDPLAGGVVLSQTLLTATIIDTGNCVTETFSLPWNNVPFDLYAAINDDGSSPPNAPELAFIECDSTNNIAFINAPGIQYNPVISGLAQQYCPENTDFNLIGTPAGGVFSGAGITAGNFNPYNAGQGTHAITYTFSYGVCVFDTTETTTVVNLATVNAGSDTSFCNGQNGSIGVNPLPGYTYYWAPTSGLSDAFISNPTVTLANSGTNNLVVNYTINADTAGCVSSDVIQVTVFPDPQAEFDFSNVCQGDLSSFTDQSQALAGSISLRSWDFGDTNVSSQTNPNNLYAVPGLYDVSLAIETSNGCVDTIIKQVQVYNRPTADFTVANVCQNVAAVFTNQSQSLSGAINQWHWAFGDMDTLLALTAAPVNHNYDTNGTYIVDLVVNTQYGCKDTMQKQVIVYPIPITDFSFDSVCFGVPTTFTDLSDASPAAISQWNWDFGGIGSSTAQNPQFTFPNQGIFGVMLSVETDSGCPGAVEYPVRVYALPETNFSATAVCLLDTTEFTNNSTIANGTISSQVWYFDDNTTSLLWEPPHVYGADGFYNVKLTLTSDKACVDSMISQVEVYPLPVVNYEVLPDTGCMPLEVVFNDLSTIAMGYNLTQWEWTFGDNDFSTDAYIVHTYDTSGFYDVTLKVTSANGCTTLINDLNRVEVYPLPHAGFVASPQPTSILYPFIEFANTSVGAAAWVWDFGDGAQASEFEPSYTYLDTGKYPVVQIAQSIHGCADTLLQMVAIDEAFTLFIPEAFTPGKDGINDIFACKGKGFTDFEMRIYNRWGEMVFFSADINTGWNGKTRTSGLDCESGVYAYSVEVMDFKKHPQKFTGQVVLIR